jgi:ubiquinone/menaquinone biosynthesis C-methylase UbiE
MSQESGPSVDNPTFARNFDRLASQGPGHTSFEPFRRETAGRATGRTLEIGAGGGYNFEYYDPQLTMQVEATEPDATMLSYARGRAAQARVPITLTQAPAEALPFADGAFDTVVGTLVFCSIADVPRGLREIARVLKPGGRLLLAEHVRSANAVIAGAQSAVTAVSVRLASNCHWNRDTESAVRQADFTDVHTHSVPYADWYVRLLAGGLLPILVIEAHNR